MWTSLVYVSAALVVSHFYAVLTVIHGVTTGMSSSFYSPSLFSDEGSRWHMEERVNYMPGNPDSLPGTNLF